jgi:hypothetical protein
LFYVVFIMSSLLCALPHTVLPCGHISISCFYVKGLFPVLRSFAKVVVAKAELNNNVHPLYTCAAGTSDEAQVSRVVLYSTACTTWHQPDVSFVYKTFPTFRRWRRRRKLSSVDSCGNKLDRREKKIKGKIK